MIKSTKRNSVVIENLNEYCHLSGDDYGYMEATEWTNGEGWDITIQTKDGDKRFSLTYGEYSALQVLLNYKG